VKKGGQMNVARKISYWERQRQRGGPVKFGIVFTDGSFLSIDLSKDRNWRQIERFSDCIGLVTLVPATGRWTYEFELAGSSIYSPKGWKTFGGAIRAMKKRIVEKESAHEALLGNPELHLDNELSHFDWYAHYSDDNRVFFASEFHWKNTIKPLIDSLPVEVVRRLWVKHAPKDHNCPV
jgi:hypothetical protein